MISKKQKHTFLSEGYLIVRSAVPNYLVKKLWWTSVATLRNYGIDAVEATGFDDPELSKQMFEFRTRGKKQFGLMFDTIQTSVSLWDFGTNSKISSTVADLMSCKQTDLSLTDLLMRMDPPFDGRNKLKWHQDSSYFRQNDRGINGCVCSMAICDYSILNRGQLNILIKTY